MITRYFSEIIINIFFIINFFNNIIYQFTYFFKFFSIFYEISSPIKLIFNYIFSYFKTYIRIIIIVTWANIFGRPYNCLEWINIKIEIIFNYKFWLWIFILPISYYSTINGTFLIIEPMVFIIIKIIKMIAIISIFLCCWSWRRIYFYFIYWIIIIW